MRTLFGKGAQGEAIRQVQLALLHTGLDPKGVDGVYGEDTAAAVGGFQASRGIAATGVLDDICWQALTQRPLPTCGERSLQLTAAFEGHGFGLAVGNFDGAYLTWGIIGFTLKHGEVTSIVSAVNAAFPERVRDAFGNSAGELLSLVQASRRDQEAWANQHTLPNGALAQPWRDMFAAFGAFPEVQQEQIKHVQKDYLEPAIRTAKQLDFRSELALALCFDIHVQNGGIKPATLAQITKQPNEGEAALRLAVANAVADSSIRKFQDDVRRRKLTIATGQGTVHGRSYLLENWGLSGEIDASELAETIPYLQGVAEPVWDNRVGAGVVPSPANI